MWEFIKNWNLRWMIENGLDYPEYALFSIINSLSKENTVCTLSKTALSKMIKRGKTKTIKYISDGCDNGFLGKSDDGRELWTTDKWKVQYTNNGSQTEPITVHKLNRSQTGPVHKLNHNGSQTEPQRFTNRTATVQKVNQNGSQSGLHKQEEQEVKQEIKSIINQEGENENLNLETQESKNQKKENKTAPPVHLDIKGYNQDMMLNDSETVKRILEIYQKEGRKHNKMLAISGKDKSKAEEMRYLISVGIESNNGKQKAQSFEILNTFTAFMQNLTEFWQGKSLSMLTNNYSSITKDIQKNATKSADRPTRESRAKRASKF